MFNIKNVTAYIMLDILVVFFLLIDYKSFILILKHNENSA